MNEATLKQLKLQTAMMACMLVIVLAVGIFVSVTVAGAARQVQTLDLNRLTQAVSALEKLEEVDVDALNGAIRSLKDAAGNLSKADVEAINDGIHALSAAAENLGDMDVNKLNELISSLEVVVAQMEKTVNGFNRFFGK